MKHVVTKVGLATGLMATSLGAMATGYDMGLHSFGESMMFAKPVGNIVYAAFVPSGHNATDSVILLELTQGSGAAPATWQYFQSTALNAGAPGAVYSLILEQSTDAAVSWGVSGSTSAYTGAVTTTFYGDVGNGTTATQTAANTSNGEISLQFTFATAVSSQTCSISFNAYVGTDDYLQYQIAGWRNSNAIASNVVTGAASVDTASYYTATTKSGGANTDTISGAKFDNLFGYALLSTGTSFAVVPTFSYMSVQFNAAAGTAGTVASDSFTMSGANASNAFKAANVCSAQANNRLALNSLGLVIGSKNGMVRIW